MPCNDSKGRGCSQAMRLAIVGSRTLADPYRTKLVQMVVAHLLGTVKPSTVVSGGAVGVDAIAADFAKRLGVPVLEFLPNGQHWDAFKARNIRIVETCDALACIHDPESLTYGSGWTRDQAERLGKPVATILIPPHARSLSELELPEPEWWKAFGSK